MQSNNENNASCEPRELAGDLHDAVEQVRALNPPEAALRRSLQQAKEIDRMNPFQPRVSMTRFAGIVGTLAAAVVVALLVDWMRQESQLGNRAKPLVVAQGNRFPAEPPVEFPPAGRWRRLPDGRIVDAENHVFDNIEIGDDPERNIRFNAERRDEMSIPGLANPTMKDLLRRIEKDRTGSLLFGDASRQPELIMPPPGFDPRSTPLNSIEVEAPSVTRLFERGGRFRSSSDLGPAMLDSQGIVDRSRLSGRSVLTVTDDFEKRLFGEADFKGRSGATYPKLSFEGDVDDLDSGGAALKLRGTYYGKHFGYLGDDLKSSRKGKERQKALRSQQVWRQSRGKPTFARVYVGDGNALELVSLRVSVTIDGPRARTLVDHVFRNPHDRQLEGTFEYPLPSNASPSYFAMFLGHDRGTIPPMFPQNGEVPPLPQDKLAQMTPQQVVMHVDTEDWGRLQEARVVSKEKALETYEDVVRSRIDPALLEYAGGNTFRGRVFPIPKKGYNRVLIAYEQLLPQSRGRNLYRFPLPDCKLTEMQLNLQANRGQCRAVTFQPQQAYASESRYEHRYQQTWKKQGPGGDVLFTFVPPKPRLQVISGKQGENGSQFVFARLRPDLPSAEQKAYSDRAVFLLDTSLSENPDRFDLNVQIMRQILERDRDLKHFKILTFNVGTAWVNPTGWLPNTKAGRETALQRLDGILLEGATDWSAALEELAKPLPDVKKGAPLNVFVLSDGNATWGRRDVNPLVARFEERSPYRTRFHCYRFGVGAENVELYQALTRRGGGVFQCYTKNDLKTVATAHRKQCWQIDRVSVVAEGASDTLVAGRRSALYPGGELVLASRVPKTGNARLRVEGTFQGEKLVREYPFEITGGSELAARAWGELAVASLLALNEPRFDELVTAYCQQFNVGSRVASFLVLENERDYKRLNLEKERGKTVSGDLGEFLTTLWKEMAKLPTARAELEQFLSRVNPRIKVFEGENGRHVKELLGMLSDEDLAVTQAQLRGELLKLKDVPEEYRKALLQRDGVDAIITESKRRLRQKDDSGAVRALSTIIERHPGRSDALRLVGYRLQSLEQSDHAVRLFEQVQRQRPFEPHSYRDLARSLEMSSKYGLAALQYEIVLAGAWHGRFGRDLKHVAREEYARMMREAIAKKRVQGGIADHFGKRLEGMKSTDLQSDLRVTMTWNTDNTDVDLWVIEPDGAKCFYSHPKTKNGGVLSQDLTQGYGPERYQMKSAAKGTYRILVNYFRQNANLIGGETHVDVVITRHAGTEREMVERRVVILKKTSDVAEVARIKF